MGITIKERKGIVTDRNANHVVIYCNDEDPDKWRIYSSWQDRMYDGDEPIAPAVENTAECSVTYGRIKDDKLPSGRKVSDLFPGVKEFVYTYMRHKMDGTGPFSPPKPEEAPEPAVQEPSELKA